MSTPELSRARWRKSTRSNGHGGACVEVAVTRQLVGVRDTKDRDGGTLAFDRAQWDSFTRALARR